MADYSSNIINKQSSANPNNNASDASSNWKFAQCFGEKGDRGDIQDITEADIISAVEFDSTGNFLASGDRGGRVVLFERIEDKKGCEYSFYTEFQSHEPEFDYLKSLEIEEKINEIEWVKRQNRAHFLLSANDKTIKLWKVYEKSLRVVAENNLSDGLLRPSYPMDIASLRLPRTTLHDTIIAATPRKIYANAHAYHINSISVSSDDETYISADDLRINLWNLEISDQSFNIVDVKPPNMEELTEVITCAQFHPQSCNIFAYSSSRGAIKLADMRMKALCDEHAKCFYDCNTPATSFFNEITTSISDTRFSPDGRYLVTRDYLSVKIWDLKMESFPIKTINVHEYLQSRLVDTYENDSIFDKFEVVWSGDSNSVLTGSYNNNAIIYPNCMPEQSEIPQTSDDSESPAIVLHADSSVFKPRRPGMPTPIGKGGGAGGAGGASSRGSSPARRGLNSLKGENEVIDFSKKILHMSWHPQENSIAVAATNNLFVFSTL